MSSAIIKLATSKVNQTLALTMAGSRCNQTLKAAVRTIQPKPTQVQSVRHDSNSSLNVAMKSTGELVTNNLSVLSTITTPVSKATVRMISKAEAPKVIAVRTSASSLSTYMIEKSYLAAGRAKIMPGAIAKQKIEHYIDWLRNELHLYLGKNLREACIKEKVRHYSVKRADGSYDDFKLKVILHSIEEPVHPAAVSAWAGITDTGALLPLRKSLLIVQPALEAAGKVGNGVSKRMGTSFSSVKGYNPASSTRSPIITAPGNTSGQSTFAKAPSATIMSGDSAIARRALHGAYASTLGARPSPIHALLQHSKRPSLSGPAAFKNRANGGQR